MIRLVEQKVAKVAKKMKLPNKTAGYWFALGVRGVNEKVDLSNLPSFPLRLRDSAVDSII